MTFTNGGATDFQFNGAFRSEAILAAEVSVYTDEDGEIFHKFKPPPCRFNSCIFTIRDAVWKKTFSFLQQHKTAFIHSLKIIFIAGYLAYIGFIFFQTGGFHVNCSSEKYPLLVLIVFFAALMLWDNAVVVLWFKYGLRRWTFWKKKIVNSKVMKALHSKTWLHRAKHVIIWTVASFSALAYTTYVLVTEWHFGRLRSILGFMLIIFLSALCSSDPSYINWRVVCSGILVHFGLSVLTLRTPAGRRIFKYYADFVVNIVHYSLCGSNFLFGELRTLFVFETVVAIIFLSVLSCIFRETGFTSYVIVRTTYLLHALIGTSAVESANAVTNIFLGSTQGPVLIRSFIPFLTRSEIHMVMVSGFSSSCVSILGAYFHYGVSVNHLLIASVITVPLSMSLSKLWCPEFCNSKTDRTDIYAITEATRGAGFFSTIMHEANVAVKLCSTIFLAVLTCISLLHLLNGLLCWLFALIGLDISIQDILGYLFYPIPYLIGIEKADCAIAGRLIAAKLLFTELVAYKSLGAWKSSEDVGQKHKLSPYLENSSMCCLNAGWKACISNTSFNGLEDVILQPRSYIVMIYGMYGFCNFVAVGIITTGLSILAPNRSKTIFSNAARAFISGFLVNIACACTASLLYNETYAFN